MAALFEKGEGLPPPGGGGAREFPGGLYGHQRGAAESLHASRCGFGGCHGCGSGDRRQSRQSLEGRRHRRFARDRRGWRGRGSLWALGHPLSALLSVAAAPGLLSGAASVWLSASTTGLLIAGGSRGELVMKVRTGLIVTLTTLSLIMGCASSPYVGTGALLGGGVGAVTGAAIGHSNPWAGALIGGLAGSALGAAGGYALQQGQTSQPQQGYYYPAQPGSGA